MFGTHASPYLAPGAWQFNLSHRNLTSDTHYRGTERQLERETEETFVVNQQRLTDLTITYGVTREFSLSLGIPFVDASWSIPLPVRPVPGPRSEQNARGLGDVSLSGRYWLFDTGQAKHNLSVGGGLKFPTGDANVSDSYPNFFGESPELKPVDQSIQPGDGGWGIVLEANGFRSLGPATLFGSFSYLLNPRNTNDTPSIIEGLGFGDVPQFEDLLVNSVPDQYVGRVGIAAPVLQTGLTASLAARIEGLPRYDLLGRSDGWRRPGREIFLEPGVAYTRGATTLSLSVPIGVHRNRLPNPYSGRAGDATFPDYILLAGVSFRFGGSASGAPAGDGAAVTTSRGRAVSGLSVRPGDAFPDLDLEEPPDAGRSLADLRAPGRRTLVNLWATWCVPCREEMPFLEELAPDLSAAGVDLVGISLDEDPAAVPPFLEELGITYPVYLASELAPIEGLYRNGQVVVPASLLLDKDGRILDVYDGWTPATEAAIRELAGR